MTEPATMLAVAIERPGGPDVLMPRGMPLPVPQAGEVLIRVAAAGVNAPDLAQRRGAYAPPPGASPLPGLEVSGQIVGAAPDSSFSAGDAVVALTNGGGYAEYVAVPVGQVLPLPRGWSLAAGAALPETFFTVEQTLVQRAGLAAGMTLLVHGAAGGLGGTAIGVARARGARAIAVVSSPTKAAYALSIGADAAILHTAEDFVARTLELTGGTGADRILDMMGGETLSKSIAAAARGGHIVLVASMSGRPAQIDAGRLVLRQLTISGSTLRPQPPEVKARIARSLASDVWPALEDGRIVPPRIRAFPLEAAAAAHRAIEDRASFGKLILLTAFGRTLAAGDKSIELMS